MPKEKLLDRVMGPLRQAFHTAVTGRDNDGTILKSAEERMEHVDSQLEEFAATLIEEPTIEKEEKPVPKTDPVEDVLKGLTEPARALIEKAQADAASALTRATEAETRVAKAEEERATEVRIAKADEFLGGDLAGDKAKLATVLKKLDGDDLAVLAEIFKGAREQAATAKVTKEIGNRGKAATDEATQLVTKSADIRKAFPSMSPEQAIAEVLKQHPELYEASLATKGA